MCTEPGMMQCPSVGQVGLGVCAGCSSAAGFKSLVICILLPQTCISNCFEIAAPANHVTALVLAPLELGFGPSNDTMGNVVELSLLGGV